MNSGSSRADVAARFLDGSEYQTLFVRDQFLELLGRAADPSTQNYYVSRMQNGMSQEALRQELLLSVEFWSRATQNGYSRRH